MNLKIIFRLLISLIFSLFFNQSLFAQLNPFGDTGYASSKVLEKLPQYSARNSALASLGSSPIIYSIFAPDTIMLPQSGDFIFEIKAFVSDADSAADVDSVWFYSRNSGNPGFPYNLSYNGNDEWSIIVQVSSTNRVDTYPFVFYAKDIEGNISDSVVHNITLIAYATFIETQIENKPYTFRLFQNFPNPFNPGTTIEFDIPNRQLVKLKIFDLLGNEVQELLNEEKNAGNYKINFVSTNLSSGIYIYQLQTSNNVLSQKMILLK